MEKTLTYYLNHKYFRHFNWYFISGMLLYGAQFLATSYLTKTNTLGDFSQYALILSICSPVFLFFNLNMRVLITKYNSEADRSTFSRLRIFTLGLGMLLCLAIGMQYLAVEWLGLLVVVAMMRGFDGTFEWSYGYFLKEDNSRQIGISQILRGVALLLPIGVGLFVYTDLSMFQFFALSVVLLFLIFVGYDYRQYRQGKPNEQVQNAQKSLKELATIGLPLGAVALFDSLSVNIPKYAFEHFDSNASIGIFTSLFIFLQTMSYLGFSVVNSTLPTLTTYVEKRNIPAISNVVTKSIVALLLFALGYLVVVWFWGDWILRLAYTPEIAVNHHLFFILSLTSIPMLIGSVLGYVLFALGKFQTYLVLSCCTAVLVFVLSYLFIPQLALLGGILAFLLAQCVKTLVMYLIYRKYKSALGE